MSRHKLFLCLVSVYLIKDVCGNDINYKQNECKDICGENVFLLHLKNDANKICERGCRFFKIIDAKGDLNISKSRNDCHSSCIEAYGSPDFEACKLGCSEMQKKRELELLRGFVLHIKQEGQNNVMVVRTDIDQVDFDISADPGFRVKLDLGYSVEYKIPETHIRTMPINDGDNFGIPPDMTLKYQSTGDWLDCASRNSGIPRWMLNSAILLAFLLGIWFIIVPEKCESVQTTEISSDTDSLICKVDPFPAPPPKYSAESDKH